MESAIISPWKRC